MLVDKGGMALSEGRVSGGRGGVSSGVQNWRCWARWLTRSNLMFGNFYFLWVYLTYLKCAGIIRGPESYLPIHLHYFYHLNCKNLQYSISFSIEHIILILMFNIEYWIFSNQYSILIRALHLPNISSSISEMFCRVFCFWRFDSICSIKMLASVIESIRSRKSARGLSDSHTRSSPLFLKGLFSHFPSWWPYPSVWSFTACWIVFSYDCSTFM